MLDQSPPLSPLASCAILVPPQVLFVFDVVAVAAVRSFEPASWEIIVPLWVSEFQTSVIPAKGLFVVI